MKTNTVVLLLLGSVALGFLGGVVGGVLLGDNGADPALANKVSALETRIGTAEQRMEGLDVPPPLNIAFVDAEGLFLKVFIPQVATERQSMENKQREILALREKYAAGELDQEAYQQQFLKLQTEAMLAQLSVNLGMLNKMLASGGFANIRADLQRLKDQANPLRAELERMLEQSRAGVLDPEGFMAQLQGLQGATEQLDQVLTQVAASKIVEISQRTARDEGYDLVLRKKEIVVYWDQDKVTEITDQVEPRLWQLFPDS